MNPVYVRGLGLWTPGFSGTQAWCEENRNPEAMKPEATLLKGPLKRRSTAVTRMAVEAFTQAATQANCDPASVPTIWATAHGEHSTAIHLLEMMHKGDGKLSPTHFHNSVHNTPGGYASIATRNVAPSTTLTGGSELVSAALFEAICLVDSLQCDIVLVFADEALKAPFDVPGSDLPLALGFCLGPHGDPSLARLENLARDAAPAEPVESFGHLHLSTALSLLEQVFHRRSGRVALQSQSHESDEVWAIDVEASEC